MLYPYIQRLCKNFLRISTVFSGGLQPFSNLYIDFLLLCLHGIHLAFMVMIPTRNTRKQIAIQHLKSRIATYSHKRKVSSRHQSATRLLSFFILITFPVIPPVSQAPHDYIGNSQSFSQNRSSITVTAILYFTSISTFSGGLAKSLSISCSSTPAIFAIVSLDMP